VAWRIAIPARRKRQPPPSAAASPAAVLVMPAAAPVAASASCSSRSRGSLEACERLESGVGREERQEDATGKKSER